MGLAISSIGIQVKYAVEATAGTRPTTGYKVIPDIKSLPDFNPEPDTIETTTFSNLEYKTYIDGLKDIGGSLAFSANLTNELYEAWQGTGGLMEKYETAKEGDKAVWLCIDIPDLDNALYFTFIPSAIGLTATETNAVLETELHMTPTGEIEWAAKPTA